MITNARPVGINLKKAKAVIYDFNGVMTDDGPDEFPVSVLEGFTKCLDTADGRCFRLKNTNWISQFKEMGVNTADSAVLKIISHRMFEHSKQHLVLYGWIKYSVPLLSQTKKLAILTNNSIQSVRHALQGYERFFSAIKTWENVPKNQDNVPELKPSPRGILSICDELKIAPCETVMIGDSQEDVEAARQAGTMLLIIHGGVLFPVNNDGTLWKKDLNIYT